jgi:hyperosmotically inducible protein
MSVQSRLSPEAGMHKSIFLSILLALSGCTVGYQLGKDDRPPSVVASDSAITSKIKGKFVADDVVSVFNIGVQTYEATVTLTGAVGSYNARQRAESLARETGGVKVVNNQITIEDQST